MDKYINRTAKLSVAQKLMDLLFAGPAPLDKYSQNRVVKNDAEVNAVFVPVDF